MMLILEVFPTVCYHPYLRWSRSVEHFTDTVGIDDLTEVQSGGKRKLRGHPAGPRKTRRKRGGTNEKSAEEIKKEALAREREFKKETTRAQSLHF